MANMKSTKNVIFRVKKGLQFSKREQLFLQIHILHYVSYVVYTYYFLFQYVSLSSTDLFWGFS